MDKEKVISEIKENNNKVCNPESCDKLDELSIFYDPCNDCDLN